MYSNPLENVRVLGARGEATGRITKSTGPRIPQTRRKENADFARLGYRTNEVGTRGIPSHNLSSKQTRSRLECPWKSDISRSLC